MTQRGGRSVPAHYGSAASELAVCVTRVGLADRSDLAVLSIAASPRRLDWLLARVLGHGIAPSGAVFEAGAWWCRAAAGTELSVLCPHDRVERLKSGLRAAVGRIGNGTLNDRSDSRRVMQVLGRRAGEVLAVLGVYGPARNPREAAPFTEMAIGGRDVAWLLEEPPSALAIVDADDAAALWQAVERAGRPHGIHCVGLDALDRYLMVERIKRQASPLA